MSTENFFKASCQIFIYFFKKKYDLKEAIVLLVGLHFRFFFLLAGRRRRGGGQRADAETRLVLIAFISSPLEADEVCSGEKT